MPENLKEGSTVEVRTPPEDGDWKAGQVARIDQESNGTTENGPRMVLVKLIDGEERWVSIDGKCICRKGTHTLTDGSVGKLADKLVSPERMARIGGGSGTSRSTKSQHRREGTDDKAVSEHASRAMDEKSTSLLAAPPRNALAPSDTLKRVALVGSSGGGAAAQGQFDGLSLLLLAKKELSQAGIKLAAVQFVACTEPLDSAPPTAVATLWVIRDDQGIVVAAQGPLSEVNVAARHEDAKIAAGFKTGTKNVSSATPSGKIAAALPCPLDGLVAISCDVDDVNSQTFSAAKDCQAPIAGTGGSSLGAAMAMGCLLVGSSGGSVATTNKSKVVSYAAGLAGHWRLKYDAAKELTYPFAPAATFGGCLPAYVGAIVVITLADKYGGSDPDGSGLVQWVTRLSGALPVVAGAVAARQVSSLGDIATAAGIIAGSMCSDNTVAALVAGTLAGYLCSKTTGLALDYGVPATSLSLYATATSGIAAGAIALFFLPLLEVLWVMAISTDVLLRKLQSTTLQAIAGAGMGCLMCYGSKVGWYHRLFLPIIVLELAGGTGGSIWGSIDLCALCMVAAGLCAAHLIRPSTHIDTPLARRGLIFNVCFGDFIEAAYPFMERSHWCNAGAYLGAALSGAIVAVGNTKSSAYIPLPLAYATCEKPLWLVAATFAAFLPTLLFGLLRPVK